MVQRGEESRVEYRVLGPLEVRVGHGPVSLRGSKQRAVLALLLLNANRVVGREHLIDELWGEAPPETAVKALQVYVSRLRKLLPEGTLVTRAPGYVLKVDPEAIDALRFERLVGEARGLDAAGASRLLREALGLWRGPAMADLTDEPFVRVEASRLEELRLAALEERIDADLALGRHAELAGELEALIVQHPHRERLRGLQMLALYRSGRQADALAAYRDARAALDELGIDLGPSLRQLERRILTQDASLDLTPRRLPAGVPGGRAPLPGPLVPTSPFPFVGRGDELAVLRSSLERAEAGEGGVVLLAGEAGSGKTRLIWELAHEAADAGTLVLYGAPDAAVSTPYQPLLEWLQFLLRVADPAVLEGCFGGGSDRLARLLPELVSFTGEPPPPSGDASDGYLIQSAAADLLRRLSELQPLLLVIDDLHWADGETLQLLRRLARTAPEARVVVVAAFRDRGPDVLPAVSDTLADLSRLEGMTRLTLGNLSNEDVSAFIRASAQAEATDELVSAIGELTEGAPLLLCELWRDLRDSSGLEFSDARVYLSRPVAELRGTERVRAFVEQRLSRLSQETASIIELAAVIGPRFELPVLAQAAGIEAVRLADALEQGRRSGMVEELSEPATTYRFTHELVRRAVYDRITRTRRAELHLSAGEALEQVHATDLDRVLAELAHHFTLAAPLAGVERAIDYNLRAAEAAIRAAAYEVAVARFSTALELGIDDPRERARVQIEIAFLLSETGRMSDSEAMLAASLDAVSGLEERGMVANALVERASTRLFYDPESRPADLEPVARQAIRTFGELGDRAALARAERHLAVSLWRSGHGAEGCTELEQALVDADASGDLSTLRKVVPTLGGVLCDGPVPAAAAIDRCRELLQSYGDDHVLEAVIGRFLSLLLAMVARFDEAREHLDRSSLVLDQVKSVSQSWVYRRMAAQARELIGDLAAAEHEHVAKWLSLRDVRDGLPDARAMQAACDLAILYCDEGRWDEAADMLVYGREVPEPMFFRGEAVSRLAVRARLAAHSGEHGEALALAERAVERSEKTDLLNLRARVWAALAEVRRAGGATEAADDALTVAVRLYEAKGNVAAARRLVTGAT
jgi:DNA-binding SARP family transcriptional activator